MKAFAIASVVALLLLVAGLATALHLKKQRMNEEFERASREEAALRQPRQVDIVPGR